MGDHYHVVKKLLAWGWGYLLMKKVSKIVVRLKVELKHVLLLHNIAGHE